ncbi:MAG TPA: DUF4391 domain-containing protein [Kofleriaceae bacterium]|nr:DUF4391 domain-containing protein [Kofleriaceae bacterium]
MNAGSAVADAILAMGIPASARVERRIPKTMLLEKAPATATDRRAINDRVEELTWLATLRPDNVGIHAYIEGDRDYREIAVLQLAVRPGKRAKASTSSKAGRNRLYELVHRAIPYPVVLWSTEADAAANAQPLLTLAHKRLTQSAGTIVLDELHTSACDAATPRAEFIASLEIARRPYATLRDLYQGWIDCITALHVSTITTMYSAPSRAAFAEAQRQQLQQHANTVRELARLRAVANRESQINKRVELNTAIKAAEATVLALTASLAQRDHKD